MPLAIRLSAAVENSRDPIGDVLRRAAALAPEGIALVDGVADPAARSRWSYAELLARAEALAVELANRLAPYKLPKQWLVVDALPVTPYGKVQKFMLRGRLSAAGS